MRRYTEREYRQARVFWVLALEMGGGTYLLAERAREITSASGVSRLAGGLSRVRFGVKSAPDAKMAQEISASLELVLAGVSPNGEAWRAFVATGRTVRGELSLLREGDAWEQRERVLLGAVEGDAWGEPHERIRCVLRESLTQGAGAVLGSNAVASETTFPASGTLAVDESAQGATYPVHMGSPGQARGDEDSDVLPAFPVLLVRMSFGSPSDNSTQDATVLCAGHEVAQPAGGGDAIRIFNMSRYEANTPQKFYEDFPVVMERDEEGRLVTLAVLPAPGLSGSLFVEGGAELYGAWLDGAGGIRFPGGTVRGFGDAIAWLLGVSTLRLAPLAPSVRSALNGYRIDGYTNTQPLARDLLLQDVLPMVPASLLPGPNGWEILWWNLRATRADAVRVFDVQRDGLSRAADCRRLPLSGVVNQLAIEYAPRADTGQPSRRLEFGWRRAQASASGARRYERHRIAVQSQLQHGARASEPIRSTVVWDPATAGRILADGLLLRALRARVLAYEGPEWVQAYRPGQVVILRDPAMELDLPCWIVGMSRGPGRQTMTLRELPLNLVE